MLLLWTTIMQPNNLWWTSTISCQLGSDATSQSFMIFSILSAQSTEMSYRVAGFDVTPPTPCSNSERFISDESSSLSAGNGSHTHNARVFSRGWCIQILHVRIAFDTGAGDAGSSAWKSYITSGVTGSDNKCFQKRETKNVAIELARGIWVILSFSNTSQYLPHTFRLLAIMFFAWYPIEREVWLSHPTPKGASIGFQHSVLVHEAK